MADTSMLHDAVTAVVAAIRNPGVDPAHHNMTMQRHSVEWPVLHTAIARLCTAYDRGEAPPSHAPSVLESDFPELWDMTYRAVWEGSTLSAEQAARVTANIILKLTSSPPPPALIPPAGVYVAFADEAKGDDHE